MKRLQRLHLLLDACTLAGCWPLAWWIRALLGSAVAMPINPIEDYLIAWPMVSFIGIAAGIGFGAYEKHRRQGIWDNAVRLGKTLFLNLLLVAALGFFFKEFDFGRAVILTYILLLAVFITINQGIWNHIERRARARGDLDIRTLVVGAGTSGLRAIQRLEDSGHTVVGFLDDKKGEADELPRPVLGPLSSLRFQVEKYTVDQVVFAIPSLDRALQMELILELEDLPVEIQVVSTLFGVLASNGEVEFIGDIPVFTLQSVLQSRPLYNMFKRIIDFSIAGVGLLCIFPVWIAIAVAIKLDSSGPVFFTQLRVGLEGREFRIFKFRTMRIDTDPYAEAPKDSGDSRITRSGAFLRRTSLDELPQLLNVLNGSMSLVGPRPEMPFIVARYAPRQRRRLDVLPGITGLWQIVGRKDLPLHENLEYDFYYMRNRSLLLDLLILLRTVPAALLQRGAY